MFLWVRLLHDRLSPAKNAQQLQQMVLDTPAGLNQAYERDLKAIHEYSEEDRDRAVMLLRWMLYAARPLTVGEMTEALLIRSDSEDIIFPANDLPDAYDDLYVDHLRRLGGSLIERMYLWVSRSGFRVIPRITISAVTSFARGIFL